MVIEIAIIAASCVNRLRIGDEPVSIYTNRTSFVGVRAYIEPVCDKCLLDGATPGAGFNKFNKHSACNPNPCLNDGTCRLQQGGRGYVCECLAGHASEKCQKVDASFNGQGE